MSPDVDPDAIPDELKERDQWLFWNASADKPRKPLPSPAADYGASWTDPDEWLSFDEALEGARRVDDAGIGYVFANTNDDYARGVYGALDLDGVIDDVGLKDWVPALDPFLEADAYIERSPSGEGLHIPLAGFEPPEWWDDTHLTPDEHEGVEGYGSKFFTFTGDTIGHSGEEVADAGDWVDEWLADVYEALTGDDPRADPAGATDSGDSSASSPPARNDEYLTREDIEEALSHISGGLDYATWRNIGYALADFFDSENTALRVFKDFSRGKPGWDDDAPDQAERIISDADSSGGVTVGTLIYHAKEGGWTPPSPAQTIYDVQDTDDVDDDDLDLEGEEALDKQAWELWKQGRLEGDLSAESEIPLLALKYIAREKRGYDTSKIPDTVQSLPAKAHNDALGWLNHVWADEHELDTVEVGDDERVTPVNYMSRTAGPTCTWSDVRYVYEESKEHGRQEAEELLRDRYHFIMIAETDDLHVYDDDTGVYSTDLSEVKGEMHGRDGLAEHWTRHEKEEIFERLRQQNHVETETLNGGALERPHICVENGVLDLFERELLPHSPDYYFTDRVPVTYDPEADTEPYESFLDSLVEREADKKALVEMVGHALTPDAYARGWKLFLMLTGDTDNGKSVFYDRVSSLLNGPGDGEEANTANVKLSKIAQNRFSKASLVGTQANIAGEVDGKKIRNTASLKDITGGDNVEIEPKGKASFFQQLNSTMMFAANDPPIIGERDKEAIAQRIVPVELPYKFVDEPEGPYQKQRIPESELKDELDTPEALSGFLNLALEGIQRLRDNHGDVSLPESPRDRLRKYEREADPMREFGERCLENAEGDYVVKADVTTLYKEFAVQQGHEVGDNVARTLHDVLRGVPDLNYTDSRPDSPDYTDTSLPLRGWDERKRVINRTTLTDEGLELAEAAGLLEDQTDDGADDVPEALAARDPQYGADLTVTVEAVSDGEYSRESQGRLSGPQGTYIGFVVPGGNDTTLEGRGGQTVRLEGVTLRTDDDGLLEAEVDDAVIVSDLDGDQTSLDDGDDPDGDPQPTDPTDADSGATAAADGGHVDDVENVAPKVVMAVSELDDTGDYPDGVPPSEIKAAVDATEEEVEHGIEKATQDGTLWEPTTGKYRPT